MNHSFALIRSNYRPAILLAAFIACILAVIAARKDHAPTPPAKLSYYSPHTGTVNLSENYVPPGVTLVGKLLPHKIFVVSDIGHNYMALDRNGAVITQKHHLGIGKNIGVDADYLYVPIDGYLEQIDKRDFKVIRRIKLPYKAWLTTMHDGKAIISPSLEDSEIALYDLQEGKKTYIPPVRAIYPRGADISGDILVIADTFGHKLIVYDMKKGRVLAEQPVYYPNSVHFVDENTVIVTEEHTNRVTEFNIRTKRYRVIFSCPFVFNDSVVYGGQVANDKEGALIDHNDAFNTPPKSRCAETYAGMNTLYSPNGARKYGDGYLIADTDNHRVVWVQGGKIVSALYGFNNPVDAVFIE